MNDDYDEAERACLEYRQQQAERQGEQQTYYRHEPDERQTYYRRAPGDKGFMYGAMQVAVGVLIGGLIIGVLTPGFAVMGSG